MRDSGLGEPRLYARFSRRFRAIVIDSLLYGGATLAFVSAAEMLRGNRRGTLAAALVWVGFALLYEPVLVARRGATVGHAAANIRVVHAATGGNPGFLRALGRFLLKAIVGLVVFIFMGTTQRHQGLHDLAFGTTVEIRNPSRATPYDYVDERVPDPTWVPAAAWRRVLVILVYSLVCFLVAVLTLGLTESAECLNELYCTPGERAWEVAVGLAWLAAQITGIVFGWNGRLPGTRSRRLFPTPVALVLAVGLGLAPGAGAQTSPAAGAADSVTALMTQYDRAWNGGDTAAVAGILSPDYQYFTSLGGVQSRGQVMGMVGSPEYVLKRAKRTELAVRVVDPVAIVSSRWEGEGTYRGTRFVDDQRCGLVWLRTGAGWRVVSEHCVQIVPRPAPSN